MQCFFSALIKKLVTARRHHPHIQETLNLYIFIKSKTVTTMILGCGTFLLGCCYDVFFSGLLKKLVTAGRQYLHIPVQEKLNLYIFIKVY